MLVGMVTGMARKPDGNRVCLADLRIAACGCFDLHIVKGREGSGAGMMRAEAHERV
jgi:hypothetical protein